MYVCCNYKYCASYCSLFFFSCVSLYPPPATVGSVTWSLTLVRAGKEAACPDPLPKKCRKIKKTLIQKKVSEVFFGPSDGIRTHSTKKNIVALLAWSASYCSLFFFSCDSLYPPSAAVGSVTWSLTLVRSGKEAVCPDPVPKKCRKIKKPLIQKKVSEDFFWSE